MPAVVVLVLVEHVGGVPLVDDQGVVEEFVSDAADEAFGDRIGLRRPHRCLDDADAGGGETASNAAVNLASRSRMRNRKRLPASSRSMTRLRACWVSQGPVGWAVTPRMCTRRVACSMTKNA